MPAAYRGRLCRTIRVFSNLVPCSIPGSRSRRSQRRPIPLLKVDQDVLSIHAYRIHIYPCLVGRFCDPGAQIKGPRVPRADNRIVLDPPLTERAPAMRTPVVERREMSVQATETYGHPLHLRLHYVAFCRRLSRAAKPCPMRHGNSVATIQEPGPDAKILADARRSPGCASLLRHGWRAFAELLDALLNIGRSGTSPYGSDWPFTYAYRGRCSRRTRTTPLLNRRCRPWGSGHPG